MSLAAPGPQHTDCLRLRFADIAIALCAVGGQATWRLHSRYQPFLWNGLPDVVLHVHYGELPFHKPVVPIFHSGGNWALWASNDRYVVSVGRPASLPSRLAFFSPDFLQGDLFVGKRSDFSLQSYPLAYPLDEVLMINLLSRGRGMLFHGCGVKDGSDGLLFAGVSGAGKSTLSRLWEGNHQATLLSDDRIVVRWQGGRFWMYGTPWHGEAHLGSPGAARLERIFVIHHAERNRVLPLRSPDAAARLLVRCFPTFWNADGMRFALEFLDELTHAVPCYEFGFVPDRSAIDFVRCTL